MLSSVLLQEYMYQSTSLLVLYGSLRGDISYWVASFMLSFQLWWTFWGCCLSKGWPRCCFHLQKRCWALAARDICKWHNHWLLY